VPSCPTTTTTTTPQGTCCVTSGTSAGTAAFYSPITKTDCETKGKTGNLPVAWVQDTSTTACSGYVSTPPPASCSDTIQNQGETDVDCGGPNCAACGDGKKCSVNSDCNYPASGCVSGVCTKLPSCNDGIKNQDEVCIDGGGVCGATCGFKEECNTDSDCGKNSKGTSYVCRSGVGGLSWPLSSYVSKVCANSDYLCGYTTDPTYNVAYYLKACNNAADAQNAMINTYGYNLASGGSCQASQGLVIGSQAIMSRTKTDAVCNPPYGLFAQQK